MFCRTGTKGIGWMAVTQVVATLLLLPGCDREQGNANKPHGAVSATNAIVAPSASTSAPSYEPVLDPRVTQSRALVGQFASKLKAALMKGMSAGGPVKAVTVCNVEAPQIATQVKLEPGWSIRRTSLKLRNPDNAPDAWEKGVLEGFDKQKQAGVPIEKLEKIEQVDGRFRYMKAIPTGALCTNCHGVGLPADLTAALDRLYPDDEARGYSAGDIRGAFSVSFAATGAASTASAQSSATTDGAPLGKVLIGAPGVAGGSVSNASSVIARMHGRFERCYRVGLNAHPEMAGALALAVRVGPKGEVQGVAGGGGAGSLGPIVPCLKSVVSSAAFSPPTGGASMLSIPLTFVSGPAKP